MMCYRDKTFCPFWKDCKNSGLCGRALTDDVEVGAKRCGLGISLLAEMPSCHSTLCGVIGEGDPWPEQ